MKDLIDSQFTATEALFYAAVAQAAYRLLTHPWQRTFARLYDRVFQVLPQVPYIGSYVKQQMDKDFEPALDEVERNIFNKRRPALDMPEMPMTHDQVLDLVRQAASFEKIGSKMSGGIYHDSEDLEKLCAEVFKVSQRTNPLHAAWPNINQAEAEVCQWTAKLFNGEDVQGTINDGGTYSIMESVRTHRNWARETKGITKPNMVIPASAHAAFLKAAEDFGVECRIAPQQTNLQVNVAKMKALIDSNTIILVGSAPNYATGIIDPIDQIAAIAKTKKIGCHVDACLGSYVLPFLEAAGVKTPYIDFRLPGVTAMSADTHKYGLAPKGSSVLLLRERIKPYQAYVYLDWQGGMYVTPNQAGSRNGANILTTWATMARIGRVGYREAAVKIIQLRQQVQDRVEDIPGISVLGDPKMMVLALASKDPDINIYRVSTEMKKRGWLLNNLKDPASFHFCFTSKHVKAKDFVDDLIADLSECVALVKNTPQQKLEGDAASYHMLDNIPAFAPQLKLMLGRAFTAIQAQTTPKRDANLELKPN